MSRLNKMNIGFAFGFYLLLIILDLEIDWKHMIAYTYLVITVGFLVFQVMDHE